MQKSWTWTTCSKNSAFKMFLLEHKRVWFPCTPTWSDTEYKNDVSRAKRSTKRDCVRRAIWPRRVTHCVYNDRWRTHTDTYTRRHTHTHTHTHVHWILLELKCVHVQELPTRTTCVSRNVGDYARSLGFASANSSCRITTRQIRASEASPKRGKTFVSSGKKLRATVKAGYWRCNIVNIAAMLMSAGKWLGGNLAGDRNALRYSQWSGVKFGDLTRINVSLFKRKERERNNFKFNLKINRRKCIKRDVG